MIYFIRNEATEQIKIGFTAGNGEDRRRDLQTGCPGELVLLWEIEGSRQEEAAWHERFAGARERGEWFRPVPELLLEIMKAKALYLEAENTRLLELERAQSDQIFMLQNAVDCLKRDIYFKGDKFTKDGVYRFIPHEKEKGTS